MLERDRRSPVHRPAREPVGVVDEQEQHHLPHGVQVAVGEEAVPEESEVRDGVGEHEGTAC